MENIFGGILEINLNQTLDKNTRKVLFLQEIGLHVRVKITSSRTLSLASVLILSSGLLSCLASAIFPADFRTNSIFTSHFSHAYVWILLTPLKILVVCCI
jgi:hypothetical protein